MKTSCQRSLLTRLTVLALVFLLVVPALAFGKHEVRINDYVIDMKGQEPAIPPELEPGDVQQQKKELNGTFILKGKGTKKKSAVSEDRQSKEERKFKKWIVQFNGPIHESDKQRLTDLGCRIGDYLPDFAFLVTMDANTKKQVEKLPFINGVVRHKPAYKIHKKLKDASGSVKVEKGKKVKLNIRVDDAHNRSLVLSEIHKKKGKVLDVSGDMVRVEVDQAHISQLSQIEELLWVEEAVPLKLLNDTTKWTIQTYVPNDTKFWDKGIHGEGQIVGIGDTGLDYDMPWFYDPTGAPIGPTHRKVAGYTPFADDYDGNFGHGTHVAGIVAGDRSPVDGLSTANGMAPKARVFMQDITPGETNAVYPPSDLGEMFITTYQAGARLHTNSWGGGGNGYESLGWSADRFMWEHKDFLAFFANGNSGSGEGTVGFPASAKNLVSVGATENGTNAENVAYFSSNGPTADGRIKPTVTAPGVAIVSADSDGIKNSFNSGTVAYSGTSMATPAVAGAAALVRQYYENGFWPSGTANAVDGFSPSAALVKATLINSAQNMTGEYTDAPIPSTGQGWGRINLSNTLRFVGDTKSLDIVDVNAGLETGTSWSRSYFASSGQAVKVTLVWTDYPGSIGAAKALVNDLDLTVTAPDGVTTYLGNVFANGASMNGGSADRLNVEEQVLLPAAQQGLYTVTVTAYNVPYGPQPFALVISGAGGISPRGFISLDKTRYNGSSTIQIKVGDQDLNQNSAVVEEVSVIVTSSTEPVGEMVRLVETGPNTAIFVGTLTTRLGPATPGNSFLEVVEGDAITAVYQDANDGTGAPATVTAAALADLIPPAISAISAGSIGQDDAAVSWTTNEPATATINYGETPALGASQSIPWLMTRHTVDLGHLKEATTYYYEVASVDEAGNPGLDNNGGSLYTFMTLSLPPDLWVYSSNYTETYQTETVIYGKANDPSGVASVTVNGQEAAYRPSDGYYEMTVPLAMGANLFTVVATDTLGNAKTLSITVTRLELPDLVITDLSNPAQGGIAEPIHVDFTLCNIGAGPAPWSGWMAFFLSTDAVISPTDDRDLLSYFGYGDTIAPGECLSFGVDIRLPGYTNLIGNTYYFGAYADDWEQVWESDETNNGRAGSQITIGGPDLTMTSVSAPQNAGTATSFTVPNTAKNIGVGASYGFEVGIYLSTDAVITPSDIKIGSRNVGFLYSGVSSSDNTLVTIPSTIPGGTYYIGVIADPRNGLEESNETNNALVGNQVTVSIPDLVMTAVSGPASAPSGSAITINSTVTAQSTGGGASGFAVGIYLSPDPMITTADIRLAERYVDVLSSGASSTAGTTATVPTSVAPGAYYIGAIADSLNSVLESDETNNALAGNQITIVGPDIVMTAVSGPVSGFTAGAITVNNTVVASSAGAVPPEFYVGIYLSMDSSITESDTLIGYRLVSGLASGASSSDTTVVTLPGNLQPGTWYIGAIADNFHLYFYDPEYEYDWVVYNNAKESDETNNALAGNTIAITGPDLTMTAASGPSSSLAGKPVVISNTVTASGGGTGPFMAGFYLSKDNVITTSDTYLGNRIISSLAPGASNSADTTFTVPAGLAPGTYYVGAIADYYNQVPESNEDNNSLAGNQITILGPDLLMTAVSGPSSAGTGNSITVHNTVSASASSGNSPGFSIGIYLSTDPTITSSDILIGSRYVSGLTAGASSAADTAVTIPATVPTGTYYIGVIADYSNVVKEPDETNNSLAGNQIAILGPDLTMIAVSGPSSGSTGGGITVHNTVSANANGGNAPGFSIGIYLSTDPTITSSDILIGSRYVSGLAAGASSAADTAVTIPATTSTGTYYIGVIADYGNAVKESDETNNSLAGNHVTITGPDLALSAVSGPASAARGGAISVSDTATNLGGSSTSYFYVGIYLSADASITESDMLLGYRYVAGLAPGASSAGTTGVTIPSSIVPGTYYIGAIADNFTIMECDEWDCWDTGMGNRIIESNEANNALAGNQIVVTGPDLTMTAVSGPPSGVRGGAITVNNAVTNSGTGASPGFSVRLYLSTDTVITGNDIYLGTRALSGLASGASDAATTTVTIPSIIGYDEEGYPIGLPPGTYYIGAIADIYNQVQESSEMNNTLTGTQIVIN
jgi:subtilase family serine protease